MKISSIPLNNNSIAMQVQNKESNVSFCAGLTAKIMQEIQGADLLDISNRLAKKGIQTDFKDNKVIAWCSEKTIDIFQQLNEKYKLKLALPKGIFVENFENLNIDSPTHYGICNFFPTKLKKNSDEITPEKTLFFNNNLNWIDNTPLESRSNTWMYIDEITDIRYKTRESSSDNFLYTFLHDFAHVGHEDHLIKKIGAKALLEKLQSTNKEKTVEEFNKKYGTILSEICENATKNGFEAVACDMPRLIVNSLDGATLMPTKNPFIGTPYDRLSFLQKINSTQKNKQELPLEMLMKDFWNGKFD